MIRGRYVLTITCELCRAHGTYDDHNARPAALRAAKRDGWRVRTSENHVAYAYCSEHRAAYRRELEAK